MIKYRHRNCNKNFIPATFAYDLPPADLFHYMFKQGESIINFPFGVTWVHPKDNYCKATGRTRALKNVRTTEFKLDGINLNGGRQHYILSKGGDSKSVILYISIELFEDTVRLDHIEVFNND